MMVFCLAVVIVKSLVMVDHRDPAALVRRLAIGGAVVHHAISGLSD